MKPRGSGRAARYAAIVVAALLLTPTSSAAPSEVVLPALADLVASAHAATAAPTARDEASQAITLLGMSARADAVATSLSDLHRVPGQGRRRAGRPGALGVAGEGRQRRHVLGELPGVQQRGRVGPARADAEAGSALGEQPGTRGDRRL